MKNSASYTDHDSFVPSGRLREDIAAARAEHASGEYASVSAENVGASLDNLTRENR